jgi:citrate synthase
MNKEYLIYKLSDEVKNSCKIDKDAFKKFNVKRGLRNEDGSGVLVGLTNIGNVVGYERDAEGKLTPTEGKLYYRGYELDDLVTPLLKEKRFGFEEVAFLLLSGQLPDKEELDAFKELLNDNMPLDHRTITHIIELEGSNIMNILARCVLEMYTFDPNPDDISRDNLMRQSIELIAKFTSQTLQFNGTWVAQSIDRMTDTINETCLVISLLVEHSLKVSIKFSYITPILNSFFQVVEHIDNLDIGTTMQRTL